MATTNYLLTMIQVLSDILDYIKNDEEAQYHDLSSEIGHLLTLINSCGDKELKRLAMALEKELYIAKGALDCVTKEFEDIKICVHAMMHRNN